jgi:hypothetical protein
LSTYVKRQQQEGRKLRQPIPAPIATLSATPVWTLEQAMKFKQEINK